MTRLRQHMAKLPFTPTRVHSNVAYLPPNINVSVFVFVRRDTIKKSLQPNYDGPYKILGRSDKFFIIEKEIIKGILSTLTDSTLRNHLISLRKNEPVVHEDKDEDVSSESEKDHPIRQTKSCRHIHRPIKLKNYVSQCIHADIIT